jgi:4-alpha-glucanotransferase
VLSTQPYELGCVLGRYGLGRFRVTQKADLSNPDDVYRSENARPEDWVLLGNHDTPTIWQRAAEWRASGELTRQASYLASRLAPNPARRDALLARFSRHPSELVHAKLADLLVCDARNVMIAFTDLFGFTEPYNVPGTISDDNWSARLPRDYEAEYRAAVRRGAALSLPVALRLALEAKHPDSELLDADFGKVPC